MKNEQQLSGPAYRIATQRLVLRCWEPGDAPQLKSAIDANLDHLRPWMPWAATEPQPLEQKVRLLRRYRGQFDLDQDFVYGVFDSAETVVLGGCGLHTRLGTDAREIGYWLDQDHTGRGLATEMVLALTRVAFEVDRVLRVEIHCAMDNARSAGVARRAGYVHLETRSDREPLAGGQASQTMIWVLTGDAYLTSPCAQATLRAHDLLGQRLI